MSEEQENNRDPQVARTSALCMQVCVPAEFTDKQVVEFANNANPAGTQNGWIIRKQGNPALAGDNERVSCQGMNSRKDCVHIILDC